MLTMSTENVSMTIEECNLVVRAGSATITADLLINTSVIITGGETHVLQ